MKRLWGKEKEISFEICFFGGGFGEGGGRNVCGERKEGRGLDLWGRGRMKRLWGKEGGEAF